MLSTSQCTRRTPFGPVVIVWVELDGRPKLRHVLLPVPGPNGKEPTAAPCPQARRASCAGIDVVADDIAAAMRGEDVPFDLDTVCLDVCTAFRQRALRANFAVPRGRVSTYQRLAAHIGNAGAARAVGTAMATNPFPIIIPCHRVIRSDGTLGGYGGGIEMKRALLEGEGVVFDASGRVGGACFCF
jgi:methylated-DNA-[protein]-cysteine S-methyltransferase